MSKSEFVTAGLLGGQTNALVKNIMAQMGIDDPVEAVRRINAGDWVVRQANLLKQVATVQVAGAQTFYAKDHIQAANIGYLGDNFKKFFLNKVEGSVVAGALVVYHLERQSLDAPIMTELGERATTSLAHFFELIKAQSKGEDGPLLVNGSANISYILGDDGNVWGVFAFWSAGNGFWLVDARSVEDLDRWSGGVQVLSR